MFANPLTERLADFIRGIGIVVRTAELPEATFLPGIDIRHGMLLIDEGRLAHPGDLLHEAGHLAVADPAERGAAKLSPSDGDEMAAIAWSWAALKHLGLDPAIVFHSHGYRGASQSYIENFSLGRTFGQPLLQFYGMTFASQKTAENGAAPFPHMLRWLR
jgi:hypothetical protein